MDRTWYRSNEKARLNNSQMSQNVSADLKSISKIPYAFLLPLSTIHLSLSLILTDQPKEELCLYEQQLHLLR